MKRIFFFLLTIILLTSVVAGGLTAYGWHLFKSIGPSTTDTVLIFQKGSGLRKIAAQLQSAGVIHHELSFILGVRLAKQARLLKAGEFQFTAGMSGQAVMAHLVSGKTIAHFVTIPEGLQSREIIVLLNSENVLKGVVSEKVPEGSILPETYQFRRGDTRDDIIRRMKAAMTAAVEVIWKQVDGKSPLASKQDLLILASIIEKETGLASERDHVAGVFHNRLRKKMRLQSDPTVAYGITLGKSDLGRPLSKKDLAAKNSYNTYVIPRLPAGPICNPGLESLKAAAAPKQTKALYFVATGTGGHVFSDTLKAHNKSVRAWRKYQKSLKKTK